MARRTIPTVEVLWKRHEYRYHTVFTLALQELASSQWERNCDEDAISERLCVILRSVCYKESRESDCEISPPQWERPIPPTTLSALTGGKGTKRPDFTCSLINCLAENEADYEISLHVECKMLGAPTSKSWVLNQNYVTEGIERFDSAVHGYGKHAPSGMMIGYIMTMCPSSVLQEVNAYLRKYWPHGQPLELESVQGDVTRYCQRLKRRFLEPPDFSLVHLWVDLRSTPFQSNVDSLRSGCG